jgi:3-oxoadipate CoA-transferase beta subunit
MGGLPAGQAVDPDLINATKEPVALLNGASISDHVVSFSMIRGGHIDLAILGAYQVSEAGDLANWDTGAPGSIPAVGGAMDLAVGAKRIFAMMEHVDRDGKPKIVKTCTYPVTGRHVVDRIYTDLAIIDVAQTALVVTAMVEGLDFAALQAASGVTLTLSPHCATLRPSGPARLFN